MKSMHDPKAGEFADAFNEMTTADAANATPAPDVREGDVGEQAGVGDWLRKKIMPGTYGDKKGQPESDRRKQLEDAKKVG